MKIKNLIIFLFRDKMNVFKKNFPLQFSSVETYSDFSQEGRQMPRYSNSLGTDSHSTKCPLEGCLRRNVRNNIFSFLCPTTQTLVYTGQSVRGMCRSWQPLAGRSEEVIFGVVVSRGAAVLRESSTRAGRKHPEHEL